MRILHLLTILFLILYNSVSGQLNPEIVFLKSKGKIEYPIQKITSLDNYSYRKSICDGNINTKSVIFYSDSSYPVQAIFDGQVTTVVAIDSIYLVVTKFGNYLLSYCGLNEPKVKKNDFIKAGQVISTMQRDDDNRFFIEIYLSNAAKELDPFPWFKKLHLTAHWRKRG